MLLGLLPCGCMLESTPILPAPVSTSEQQLEVLQIVKPGTPRDEAIALLNEAGIHGSFGTTGAKAVYYCDVWNREDGERWHLDVALLFDESGRVINTRLGESATTTDVSGGAESNPFAEEPVPEKPVAAADDADETRSGAHRTAFRTN